MQEDTSKSLDPRINRVDLPANESPYQEDSLFQWQTYEVFVQQKRGEQHMHQGSLHAPNPEMALVLAKEQFGRREQCANIWIVKTADITATRYEDAGMFQHAFDKSYREGEGYKVKTTIESFKKELDDSIEFQRSGEESMFKEKPSADTEKISSRSTTVVKLSPYEGNKRRKIIIRTK